jgi:hypothetical protein
MTKVMMRYVVQCGCGVFVADEETSRCPKCGGTGSLVKGEQGYRMPYKQAEKLVRKLKQKSRHQEVTLEFAQ